LDPATGRPEDRREPPRVSDAEALEPAALRAERSQRLVHPPAALQGRRPAPVVVRRAGPAHVGHQHVRVTTSAPDSAAVSATQRSFGNSRRNRNDGAMVNEALGTFPGRHLGVIIPSPSGLGSSAAFWPEADEGPRAVLLLFRQI
jgi:hypothetical protein